ncbi:hypothetical protein BSL78_06500 [Apostichopus japonicus]|uniref:Sm protein G n=1 Tax=Stichopus japonicus TaxID=307972 RepID=A0A2G8L8J4_STIJA|nr:hypothetical protein BSL78_06500 [Apostichopus japonicus]
MDKKLLLKLNGKRQIIGVLRGFDPFMNLVIDEAVEDTREGTKNEIGMVVQQPSSTWLSKLFGTKSKKPEEFIKKSSENEVVIECHCLLTFQVVRGNSIILLEALDRVV